MIRSILYCSENLYYTSQTRAPSGRKINFFLISFVERILPVFYREGGGSADIEYQYVFSFNQSTMKTMDKTDKKKGGHDEQLVDDEQQQLFWVTPF